MGLLAREDLVLFHFEVFKIMFQPNRLQRHARTHRAQEDEEAVRGVRIECVEEGGGLFVCIVRTQGWHEWGGVGWSRLSHKSIQDLYM